MVVVGSSLVVGCWLLRTCVVLCGVCWSLRVLRCSMCVVCWLVLFCVV